MTQMEDCTRALWRWARTSLFMRGRSNDTFGILYERLSDDWQEQTCLCEAVAMTQLEHCTKGFLAIGKNWLVCARP